MKATYSTQLGCGLIRIGREWGFKKDTVPSEKEVKIFLEEAVNLGIHFFDTAPSYGLSEERLGNFLQTLPNETRAKLTVTTKCGEHWDNTKAAPYTDHSYDALVQSIDQSLARLGSIELLQVHKTTPTILASRDLKKAIAYAKAKGIKKFGASVSEYHSAQMVCSDPTFSSIQFPFNKTNQIFEDIVHLAQKKDKIVIINRPFNMGELLYEDKKATDPETKRIQAYQFILKQLPTSGIILTGTTSPFHLQENIKSFILAQQ